MSATPIIVSTSLLCELARVVHAEVDRPIGVLAFLPGEMVATNGHILVRVPLPFHVETPFGIARDHLRMAVAAQDRRASDSAALDDEESYPRRRSGRSLKLWPHPNHIEIAFDESSVRMSVPSMSVASYPKVEAVMPNPSEGAAPAGIALSVKYIAAISRIAAAAEVEHDGLRIEAWGRLRDPLMFAARGLRIVVMPISPTGAHSGDR